MLKKKLTFGYILFVGIPLLILLGTLRAGAGLTALPAVSGDWSMDPVSIQCSGPIADGGRPALSIYQNGTDLRIAFNDARKTTLAGKLESGRVIAVSNTTACGSALHLDAILGGKPGHRLLQGRLSLDGCDGCAAVPFFATKLGK
jgi:hypothetical protein